MTAPRIDQHLISLLQPRSFEAEQYRVLRHVIEEGKDGGLNVIAVSSATVGDGKTTTSINLAGTLAQNTTARVLLIDVDLRRGSVAAGLRLRAPEANGLVDAILTPGLDLSAVVRELPEFRLSVVPSGRCPAAPYEMLKSPRLGQLIGQARDRYEYVVIDTPPLVPVPDARVVEKWVDGFVIVVRAHRTPQRLLEDALNMVSPEKLIGLVFNGDQRPTSRHYGYYSSYYHEATNGQGTLWTRIADTAKRPFRSRVSGTAL